MSYHKWNKAKLQAYLDKNEVPYPENATVKDLKDLVKEYCDPKQEPTQTERQFKVLKTWKCELAGRVIDVVKGDMIDLNEWEYNKLSGAGVV